MAEGLGLSVRCQTIYEDHSSVDGKGLGLSAMSKPLLKP